MPSRVVTNGVVSDSPPSRRIWFWAGIATLASFLFGYYSAVVAGAQLFIKDDLHLGTVQQGAVVSVLLAGAAVGGLCAGRLGDRFGRRSALLLAAVLFIAGGVLAVATPGFGILLAGRIVQGLGIGLSSVIVPLYLSEIAPAELRGRLVTINQLMLTVGIMAAYVVNLAFAAQGDWRWMFGVGLIPSVLLLVGIARLPESPVWLEGRGRLASARRVLAQVYGEHTADIHLSRLQHARRAAPASTGLRGLTSRAVRPALLIGVVLAVLQQFVGINAVIYYAPTIMQHTGLDTSNAILYSLAIGVLNVVMTLVSIRLIDRWGRRPLLLTSLSGMAVALVILGATFVWQVPAASVIALICLLAFIAFFAIGMGPVFWLLLAEIFPPAERGTGAAVSATSNWIANIVVSQLFLSLVAGLGQGPTFWLFAAVCVLGLIFVRRRVIETKGKDFADITRELSTA
ncbi:sugar porter family MFS transporter [Nocardia huaxiensis]|uniref:Sugar porter family MFS transporter n=1 Tax=Nocardia huaxiensis TaxID=2755382 RepID=A0A7D6VQB4_9NOCA|nr:sugar porter family MFS transporter [Nocardia huaxiensis]